MQDLRGESAYHTCLNAKPTRTSDNLSVTQDITNNLSATLKESLEHNKKVVKAVASNNLERKILKRSQSTLSGDNAGRMPPLAYENIKLRSGSLKEATGQRLNSKRYRAHRLFKDLTNGKKINQIGRELVCLYQDQETHQQLLTRTLLELEAEN